MIDFTFTRRLLSRSACVLISLGLFACTVYQPVTQSGIKVTPEQLSKLTVGTPKAQVQTMLGSPLLQDVFHDKRWEYVYRQTQGNKVLEQSVLTVTFDEQGKLLSWAQQPEQTPVKAPTSTPAVTPAKPNPTSATSATTGKTQPAPAANPTPAIAAAATPSVPAVTPIALPAAPKAPQTPEKPATNLAGTFESTTLTQTQGLTSNLQLALSGLELMSTTKPTAPTAPTAPVPTTAPQTITPAPVLAPMLKSDVAVSLPVQTSTANIESSAKEQTTAKTPNTDGVEDVLSFVESWRASWQSGNLENYVRHYSLDFKGTLPTRAAWFVQRKKHIVDRTIQKISLDNLRAQKTSPTEARAYFWQDYVATDFKENGEKTLLLKKIDGNWLIVGETFN